MAEPMKLDRELEQYRSLMTVPDTFEEGFRWSSFFGVLFVGMLMVPGSLYMGLLAGGGTVGAAAQWVTVILFIEVAKRTHQTLKKAEIFILFGMAGTVLGVQSMGLLWSQFYIQSDAAVATGIAEGIPRWVAPATDSNSYAVRSFFHWDWLPAIGMLVFGTFFGSLSNMVLGYALFRVTSDVEKLPFPMAPIGAQGILAVAEDADVKRADAKEQSWRWRTFALGGAMGLAWGAVYLLLPTLTSVIAGQAIQIFPIPFADFTATTQDYLPAVATGINWDLGNVIVGMVLPLATVRSPWADLHHGRQPGAVSLGHPAFVDAGRHHHPHRVQKLDRLLLQFPNRRRGRHLSRRHLAGLPEPAWGRPGGGG